MRLSTGRALTGVQVYGITEGRDDLAVLQPARSSGPGRRTLPLWRSVAPVPARQHRGTYHVRALSADQQLLNDFKEWNVLSIGFEWELQDDYFANDNYRDLSVFHDGVSISDHVMDAAELVRRLSALTALDDAISCHCDPRNYLFGCLWAPPSPA